MKPPQRFLTHIYTTFKFKMEEQSKNKLEFLYALSRRKYIQIKTRIYIVNKYGLIFQFPVQSL